MSAQGLRQKRQAERFEAYRALRDAGTLPHSAGRQVGLADSSWPKYERAYRELRGLPAKLSRGVTHDG